MARTDESVPSSDPLAYLIFPLLTGPWVILTVLGLLVAAAEVVRRLMQHPPRWLRRGRTFVRARGPGLVWALLMIVVPIVVMSLFRDRKDRYLLPLIPPAAVLAGVALRLVAAGRLRRPRATRAALGAHWLLLLVFVVGIPIATGVLPRDEYADPSPWLSPWLAAGLAMVGLVCWLLWFRFQGDGEGRGHKWLVPARVVTATVFLFLFATNVFLAGYSTSREGKADLKPIAAAIRDQAPDAEVWHGEAFVPPGLLIYGGRVVRALPDELDPQRRNLFVKRQRRADVDPPPTMPLPWRVLTTARRDRSVWWAFIDE